MIASIWAQTWEGVIGRHGKIPWHYPGDFKRFKRVTAGSTIVMGRRTWESIGRALPNRKNVIISSRPGYFIEGAYVATSLQAALLVKESDLWFIGGTEIYRQAMLLVDLIDVTYVPDEIDGAESTLAPPIDESIFQAGELLDHEDEPLLKRRIYLRRTLAEVPYDEASNRRLQERGHMTRRSGPRGDT